MGSFYNIIRRVSHGLVSDDNLTEPIQNIENAKRSPRQMNLASKHKTNGFYPMSNMENLIRR